MKSRRYDIFIWTLIFIGCAAGAAWMVAARLQDRSGGIAASRAVLPVPVEVAMIETGAIKHRRTFTGELKAAAELIVAPKVGGRLERVFVNIADTVERGRVVAELDNDEYVQAVAQAKADLIVARANLSEAESALIIADREFNRTEALKNRGITAASDFDVASQNRLAKQAQVQVAAAQVKRAESSLEIANIRLGYTKVIASWNDGGQRRVVAARHVEEGQTVAANVPLFLIVQLDPIIGVVYVTERDYPRLKPGQEVVLTLDAFPDEHFSGRIDRVAPVFDKATRQARIEMLVDNPRHKLKPGMFIKASVVLAQVSAATIVPFQAVTQRNGRKGIFVVDETNRSVAWHEVKVGLREDDRLQVEGTGLTGKVVTLGQQMVTDGSAISIAADPSGRTGEPEKAKGQ